MPTFLPLFPLKLVVFPGEKLNLHIFEPRYRQLINECEQEGIPFGIVPLLDGKIADFGTEVALSEVAKRYDDGELDIKTIGKRIFKIDQFQKEVKGKLYSGADVHFISFSKDADLFLNEEILNNVRILHQILDINVEIPQSAADFITYDLAHQVGFNILQELEFLAILEEQDRQKIMLAHLLMLIPMAEEMRELQRRAKLNGHFKNEIPPLDF